MADPETANIFAADPRNYQTPGRVSLWFRPKGSTLESDWREFGNVIGPAVAPAIERLDHWSQRRGLRAKDRSVITERSAQLNFSIDEINLDNLRYAFGSADPAADDTVDTHDSKVFTNPGGSGTIDLGMTDIKTGSVVVRDTRDETPTIYVVTTDYTVVEATGIITITPGGALNDAVAVPEIHIAWQKNLDSQSFEMFSGKEIEGEAKFQVHTPGGIQGIAVFNNVIIRNNGDITWGDGTTWQEIPLQLDILVDSDDQLGTYHVIDEADEL